MKNSTLERLRRLAGDNVARNLAGNSLAMLIIRVGSAGLTYAMLVLFARAMSVPDFGRFSFGFNLATFLAVAASLGAQVGITRWWPEYTAKGEDPMARLSFRWGALATLVGAAAMTGTMLAGAAVVAGFLDIPTSYLFLAALLIAPLAFAEYFVNAMRAMGSVVMSQLPKDVLWRIACCAAALAFILTGRLMTASTGLLIASATLAALILWQFLLVRQNLPRRTDMEVGRTETEREWRRTVVPLWGAAVLHAMIQYIDVVLVGLFLSPEAAGPYFAVVRTANLIGLMSIASTLVCAPLISHYVHSGQIAELQRLLRFVMLLISLPTLGAYGFLLVAGVPLLQLFDPSFGAGYYALILLGLGYTFNALCGAVGYSLMLTGNEGTYLKIMSLSYSLVLMVQLVAIPLFGMIGAAFGSAMGMFLWNIWARRVAVARVGIDATFFCLLKRSKAQHG